MSTTLQSSRQVRQTNVLHHSGWGKSKRTGQEEVSLEPVYWRQGRPVQRLGKARTVAGTIRLSGWRSALAALINSETVLRCSSHPEEVVLGWVSDMLLRDWLECRWVVAANSSPPMFEGN